MNRMAMMVMRNALSVPGAYWKLCRYAKHTNDYSEMEKYRHIQYIFQTAIRTGNVDLQVFGKENLPEQDGFMLYSNHQGMFDILAIVATCDHPMGGVLKKELYKIPFIKQVVDCSFSFPMDRGNLKQSLRVINGVIKEVKKGRNYLIFPEGTRSRRGNEMLPFHGGSFKCATKTKCPVVPIALVNCFKVFDEKGCKPVQAEVHYLPPIYHEEYENLSSNELAELVHARIERTVKARHRS